MDDKKKSRKTLFEAATLPEVEEKVNEYWQADKTFEKSLKQTAKDKPFTFYDGPPFATGLPHYGHILASTIKDVIPRFETMRGHYVRRRWGWDCHGLPIEEIVERQLGISGKKQIEDIGIMTFNETCRATVLTYVDEWRKMVRRMGRWIEFDNSYKTMDRDYMESVWWAFRQLWDKGLIYEGRKVLLYCPRCETPLSNFEVAMDQSYKDVTEESVYVKFKLAGKKEYILAWTTTPWTLPGNVALAVGADIDYAKVKTATGETLILAKEMADKILGADGYEITAEMKGAELVGLSYEPLFDVPAAKNDKAFKIYAADFVTTEEGTGVVHTAVVYGEDDYQLGLREGLPIVPLLDEKGHFNDKAPELIRGQYFKKAEKAVKEDLESRGLLFRKEMSTHSYPHCWRCGTALFYNAIPAWFVNIQEIKGGLLQSNEKEVSWFPAHLKNGRYAKSVEAAPDWNISRNRYWGNPIPVWKCEKCEAVKVAGSIKDLGLEPTTFYFTRHAEAEQNASGIISSWPEKTPHHLTAKGEKEALKLAKKMQDVDLIYASDLTRTKETAEAVARATGKEVIFDARLREFNTGVWNGRPEAEFDQARPAEGWWDKGPEGGETWKDIERRMLEFVHETAAKNPGKKILVVSHGDPLWLILRKFGVEIKSDPDFAEPNEITMEIPDLHRPYIDEVVLKCDECGGDSRRITEIFDSWVEAGSMPFAEYHFPFENRELFESRYPAQFVAEYIAQTRAWFYVMHVMGFTLFGKAPFENVVTTGTILAEDGSKMSKSKNNYPDPWTVINKFGVDSLRFYLMNSVVMQADNLNFSEKDLENTHRKVTMLLWNVYQYFMTYAGEAGWSHSAKASRDTDPKHILDLWIAARTKELVRETTSSLDGYDTVRATRTIENFIDDLSTWYLRRSRGRTDAGFFATFYETLTTAMKVLAPFMPHLADAMYMNLTANFGKTEDSVHLASWPEAPELSEEEKKLLKDMEVVREAASLCLALRKQLNIPVRQPLARMSLGRELSPELAEILKGELNVKEVISCDIPGGDVKELAGERGMKISLDTNLTDELRIEGLTRALERFVQEMRKTGGYKVGEKAALIYQSSDADIDNALLAFNKSKTYVATIEKGDATEEFSLEGKTAKFSLKRV